MMTSRLRKGIYAYVLTRNEKYLSIRGFTEAERRQAYERQGGICPICGQHFEIDGMVADHITPWSQGGKTNAANCQMLCREDNRRKGAI
jgi:5-methylcytosine-specific restriction endonuclease McrA